MSISYYDKKWPDKMVILITSHGYFSRDYEGEDVIKTCKVPSEMKINYLYTSDHGSVTAYIENDAKRMFDFIKTHLSEILSDNPDDTKSVLSQYSEIMLNAKDRALNKVTNDIKKYKQLLQNSIRMCNKQKNRNRKYRETIDELISPMIDIEYTHENMRKSIDNSYLKGFRYKTYNSNSIMPNKMFYREICDVLSKKVGLQKYNYAIRLMSLKNQPDILDLLQYTRYKKGGISGVSETPIITTEQMIEMCIQHGVKEITIIDSACGSLAGNDREIRNFSRTINREPNIEFLLNKKM